MSNFDMQREKVSFTYNWFDRGCTIHSFVNPKLSATTLGFFSSMSIINPSFQFGLHPKIRGISLVLTVIQILPE